MIRDLQYFLYSYLGARPRYGYGCYKKDFIQWQYPTGEDQRGVNWVDGSYFYRSAIWVTELNNLWQQILTIIPKQTVCRWEKMNGNSDNHDQRSAVSPV